MYRSKEIFFSIICLGVTSAAALAYSSGARNSLLQSRDAVSAQKAQLERAYSDVDKKIAQLQDQKYSIGRYLTDCDKTLRDIDRALSAQDSAYRGR